MGVGGGKEKGNSMESSFASAPSTKFASAG
jgi:hypothetical protein